MEKCNEEMAFAIKYKKIKICENLYIYKFKQLLENVCYEGVNNTITYYENNKKKTLFDIEDPDFVISDEKDCYGDLMYLSDLKDVYQLEDVNELKSVFEKEKSSILKYGLLNVDKETMKIVGSYIENIMRAEPDSSFFDYFIDSNDDGDSLIIMPIETIKAMKILIAEGNIEELNDRFNNIDETMNLLLSGELTGDINMQILSKQDETKSNTDETIEQLIEQLNKLVGLENVKEIVNKLTIYLDYLKKVENSATLNKPNLNMIFAGNPGTGKTTVARIISKILYKLGYTKNNKFSETTSKDYIGGYVGQTAIKTHETIEKNRGGVVLIDEAYSFANNSGDFAKDALAEILKEMENPETIFIFAGYEKEMKGFIDMNSGLKSRIGIYMNFKDFNTDELFEIFTRKLEQSKLNASQEALMEIRTLLSKYKEKENFGNGRFIDKLFDKLIINHAQNVKQIDDLVQLTTLTKDDIDDSLLNEVDVKQKTLGFH